MSVNWKTLVGYGATAVLGVTNVESSSAQLVGTVSGTVIEASSSRPLPDVEILLTRTPPANAAPVTRTLTDQLGEFTLSGLLPGPGIITVRRVGYTSQRAEVSIVDGQTTILAFQLRPSTIRLDEIVVTGTGGAYERKKVGNTIATIDAADLRDAPVSTFSQMIQGREPSVLGLPSGGQAGAGARIRIRGSNSLSMSNEPIVYVDGMRIDNSGGSFVGPGVVGSGSRLDDINPNAIDRIEILKGAAAGTLYGSEASSGVIQVFTKQGRTGDTRFNLRVDRGISRFPNRIQPNAGFARDTAQAAKMSELYGMDIQPFDVVERTFAQDIFGTGVLQSYSGDVSGGSSDVQYYLAARYAGEDGPLDLDELGRASDIDRKVQANANVTLFPRDRLTVRVATSLAQVHNETLTGSHEPLSPVTLAMTSKPENANCDASTVDSNRRIGETTPVCTGPGNATGSNFFFGTVREAAQVERAVDTDRFAGAASLGYSVTPSIHFDGMLGIDVVNDRGTYFEPQNFRIDHPEGDPDGGDRSVEHRNHRELTMDAKVRWNTRLGPDLSSELVTGTQGFVSDDWWLRGRGSDFPAQGLEVLSAATQQTTMENSLSTVNLGVLVQEQIGFREFAYLTVGGRWDRNSTFGENAEAAFYPKASLSIVPSDLRGWHRSPISSLRLRTAIGKSGLQPGAFDKLTTYAPAPSSEGPGVQPENIGNASLQPERSTEIELGGEIGLLEDRASVSLTYWNRVTRDALVPRRYPAAGGFLRQQLDNIGRIDAHGWEVKFNVLVVDREAVNVELWGNASFLRETITDMGGAPPIRASGTYPRYRNALEEGYAPGTYFGVQLIPLCAPGIDRTCYTPGETVPFDSNGDGQPDTVADFKDFLGSLNSIGLSDPRLRPLLDDADADGDSLDHALGKPTPDWQGSFGAHITVWNRLRLHTLFEYRAGNYGVANITDAFRRSNAALGRNLRASAEVEAMLLNPATQNDVDERYDAAMTWVTELLSLAPYSGLNLVQKGDFVRWRELGITYEIPQVVSEKLGLSYASVSITGRNLHLWSGYAGADPEANAISRCAGQELSGGFPGVYCNFVDGSDLFTLPLPRSVTISMRFGF